MDERTRSFLEACKSGSVLEVKEMVGRGFNPRVMDDLAICQAAAGEQLETVKYLLERCKLHPDAIEGSPLRHAAAKGNVDIIHELVQAGADVTLRNSLALIWASIHGQIEAMKYLISAGADKSVLSYTSVATAAGRDEIKMVRFLVEELLVDVHGGEEAPLRHAVIGNNPAIAEYLLKKCGANVHFDDEYAIRHASSKGYGELLELLIETGADVNAHDGEPLCTVVRNNDLICTRLLLVKGKADVHVKNEEPLRHAFENQNQEMLRLLVEKGQADVTVLGIEEIERVEDKSFKNYLKKKRKPK